MDISVERVLSSRLLLHGIAPLRAYEVIGAEGATFAGTHVRVVRYGEIAALVSSVLELRPLPRWLKWMPRTALADMRPCLSALSSLVPFLPVGPRTLFADENALRGMLASRESEIISLVGEHAEYIECDISASFAEEQAAHDLLSSGPLALLKGDSPAERSLIDQSLNRSVTGRRATFLARLARRLSDQSVDMVSASKKPDLFRRRVLIPRDRRAEFRSSLQGLAEETGAGAELRIGPFLPPLNFRRLEIASADTEKVQEACAALGLSEAAERRAIRTAYERSVQRCYPGPAAPARKDLLARLELLFGLLDLVAEGQIKASRGAQPVIRFDEEALSATWLMRFQTHDLADKAA